jgi:redox-sensitive bicupin YhaK (pirin superfamily)
MSPSASSPVERKATTARASSRRPSSQRAAANTTSARLVLLGRDDLRTLTPGRSIRLSRKGATVFQPIPAGWTTFAYTLTGAVSLGGSLSQPPNYTVVLSSVDGQTGVELTSASDDEARLVLIAGEPLDQEIVQYGPFVLTSERDARQAFMDYRVCCIACAAI